MYVKFIFINAPKTPTRRRENPSPRAKALKKIYATHINFSLLDEVFRCLWHGEEDEEDHGGHQQAEPQHCVHAQHICTDVAHQVTDVPGRWSYIHR